MTESDLAEAAHHAADVLNLDLSDPACFSVAEQLLREVESGLAEPFFDSRSMRCFLVALSSAADDRAVPPSQLWRALDALERC